MCTRAGAGPGRATQHGTSVEPETVKTDLAPADGTRLPNGNTPPQANINGAPVPAPQSPAAVKAPAAKAAGRVAKPLKPALARHPKAETPAPQPSPVTDGPLGVVQNAVNSLTSTTAKLFEWGRN